jgi:hypothetical protein
MNSRRRVNSTVMLLSLITAPAILLEVMDKEASVTDLWVSAVIIGVGGFLLARYRYWLALPVLAFALFRAWGHIGELRDPFVGPEILHEAGGDYWFHSYVTITISLVIPMVGAAMGWFRIRKHAT